MLDIKTFQFNLLQENTYIVSDETRQCVVIDCGAFFDNEREAIVAYLHDQHLKPVHLLCTHGHLDHCFGNDTISEAFGLLPEVHADDEFLATDLAKQATDLLNVSYNRPTPPVGRFFSDGDIIAFGTHELRVLHTPGHTPGSVSFYCEAEKVVFTGDTLFRMSVGRTDLERGSWQQLLHSLRDVLGLLPPDTVVYCGHGPNTTIGDECRANPYLR